MRHFTILLGVVAALAVAGCGGDDDGGGTKSKDEQVRLAVFLQSQANTYAQAQLNGVKDAAKRLNAKVTAFDGAFDTSKQTRQLQDAITSGRYDGLVISPNDGNALLPDIQNALAQDIQVSCMLSPCGPKLDTLEPQIEGTAQAGTSFPANGKAIAEGVVKACEGKDPCKVAYLPGVSDVPYEKARLDGFMDTLKPHPNIKVVARQDGQYLADPALKATQNILQGNSDLDVIASSGDQMIVGAEQALEGANLEGKVELVGNGASVLGVKAIKEGRWNSSAVYLPYTEGRVAAEYVIKKARGEENLKTSYNMDEYSSVGAVVTKANADKFKPEWQG
jgi:ribose transport system substrate-binding protein